MSCAGADLANLLNEAAILAGRRNRNSISLREIDDSVDRIVAGMEGKPLTDGKAKSLVAYHEVGHAICGTLTPGHDPVQKVTLIPAARRRASPGSSQGMTPPSYPSSRCLHASSALWAAAPQKRSSSGMVR